MVSFNLVYEPWIPCRMLSDSTHKELSFLNTLSDAHEIKEVIDPSPLVTVSLHRLMLAVLHRIFGPESLPEWQDLWAKGAWDTTAVTAYLERWSDRFDLFHPQRPFYQVKYMEEADEKPVVFLAQEAASANNTTLFDHSTDTIGIPMVPAEAARYLLAGQAYSVAGGKSKPFYFSDSSLTRGYTVLVHGNNLFESLALNLIPYNDQRPIPWLSNEDPPSWEKDELTAADRNGTPVKGYLHYLTWQSRRIHLIPSATGQITRCQVQQNHKLAAEQRDPFKTYRSSKQAGWVPLGLSPQKALWRDSQTLFQDIPGSSARPDVFNWLARIKDLRDSGHIVADAVYEFSTSGFATEPRKTAKITLWRRERLPLPLAYLQDPPELLERLKEGLQVAEQGGAILRSSLWVAACNILFPGKEPESLSRENKNRAGELVGKSLNPEAPYWSQLESPFKSFMVTLAEHWDPSEDDPDAAIAGDRRAWAEVLGRSARRAFTTATASLESSPRSMKALAVAQRAFNTRLAQALANYTGPTDPTEGGENIDNTAD